MTAVQVRETLERAERSHLEDDARQLWEDDGPMWLGWEQLSEDVKNTYRAIAAKERNP